ncbi:GDNF family receptor alpha-4 isoform X2 [Erinaceus europaeus]|uniref:GDNF family receptor alpha-4 isoform X2 n=1 Tax=Erinaceus europaeus TaxID=9365 RepID=A0ABM3X2V8_ERIEU|nr:GDNF family receptor alpha-4 isoform X2 [Erinaceus europaeus]
MGATCWRSAENCSLFPRTLPAGAPSSAGPNRCVEAAEACTADARCGRLRAGYVAQCLARAAAGGCTRSRCRRALRRFFERAPPALTQALLFCPCGGPACAERRRQTFVPACAFSGPGSAPPSCLEPLAACEHSRVCRPRLLTFQAFCAPDGCPPDQAPSCLRAYAGLVDGAIQAFGSRWPLSLQGQDPAQRLVQASSTDGQLEGHSLLSVLPFLVLQHLL